MIGGLMKTTSRFAVAAAAGVLMGGVALSPAQAADLGGDCCADLEERVAELEATTVRKGNRKVSVKLSGQVNRSLLIWDDGNETDVYSVDGNPSGTRWRLTGSATIRPGWSAGFYIEYQTQAATSSSANQISPGAGSAFTLRHTVWYFKWDKYGKVWLGQHSSSTDNLIYLNLGSGTIGSGGHDVGLVGGGFFLTRSGVSGIPANLIAGETWAKYLPSFDAGNRFDLVRYDSPDILGCVFSAAWGENDNWDVAARCKKELNSVKILFGIGYIEHRGNESSTTIASGLAQGGNTVISTNNISGNDDLIVTGAIMHDPTGLYFNAVYTEREFSRPHTFTASPVRGLTLPADNENFWLQAGIYRRFNDLGKTSIYVDWRHAEDAAVNTSGANFRTGSEITDTEADAYGFGIVQKIDNAAMELYLDYKHFEVDVQTCTGAGGVCTAFFNEAIDDFDRVHVGGRIKF
ncbi:MAG: hypothetical protein Kow0032_26680 [Methyloligellaceae bacterium]